MKKTLSLILTLLIALICLSAAGVTAFAENEYTYGSFKYVISNNKVTITGVTDKEITKAVIPSEIGGKPVTSIGDKAFKDCKTLTTVTIPGSVTSIGDSAFSSCYDLTGITIPNSVTSIGEKAFDYCRGLTSVTIGNSVTSIGDYAFIDCSGLTTITVSEGNTVYDSRNNCNAIIETKSNTLLLGCKNTTIPDSVTSIGDYAFEYCKGLTGITIPGSVTSIGKSAFSICSKLTSITIPNSVTSIGDSAFEYCKGLTGITIPDSVTSIGDSAFFECENLASVTIGNSVTSIGQQAFCYCSALTSITIPDSVTSIENSAFLWCKALTSIKVSEGNTVYDSRNNCNAIIETKTNTLLFGCKNTTIPNSVTSIGKSAFNCCKGLTSITIPDSVTSIGWCAFVRCSGLKSITIPDSVTYIDRYAFSECTSLERINVDSKNTYYFSVDDVLFGRENKELIAYPLAKNNSSYIVPNGVEVIGYFAFYGSKYLTSITIPKSVNTIEDYAIKNADIDICYEGSESDRNSIDVGSNEVINKAQWHYDCEIDDNGVDIFTQSNAEPETETITDSTKDDTNEKGENKKTVVIASAAAGIVLLVCIIVAVSLLSKKSKKEKETKGNQEEQ